MFWVVMYFVTLGLCSAFLHVVRSNPALGRHAHASPWSDA